MAQARTQPDDAPQASVRKYVNRQRRPRNRRDGESTLDEFTRAPLGQLLQQGRVRVYEEVRAPKDGVAPLGGLQKGEPGKWAKRRMAPSRSLAAVRHAPTGSGRRSPATTATTRAIAREALGGS